jgi:NADP-dependent 3-hydroxy acid dehydrogenase YdfG
MIITGNKNKGLAAELYRIYPDAVFVSRDTGYDLTSREDQERLADEVLSHDVFINVSALWRFNQTMLLDTVYKKLINHKKYTHIICVGSTTDRVKNGRAWIYNAEKKALRDYCNTLGINGVWGEGPKVSLISFGSLSNVQDKHPDRRCMAIEHAAQYIKWIVEQPRSIAVNELSIDPMQNGVWYA